MCCRGTKTLQTLYNRHPVTIKTITGSHTWPIKLHYHQWLVSLERHSRYVYKVIRKHTSLQYFHEPDHVPLRVICHAWTSIFRAQPITTLNCSKDVKGSLNNVMMTITVQGSFYHPQARTWLRLWLWHMYNISILTHSEDSWEDKNWKLKVLVAVRVNENGAISWTAYSSS